MTERVRLDGLTDERAVEALGGTPRVVRLSLAAGESMPPHRHPERVVVVHVLEGRLDLRPDGRSLELGAGALFRFDGGEEVAPLAVEDAVALVYLVALEE